MNYEDKCQTDILLENWTEKPDGKRINSVIPAGEKRGDTLPEILVPLVNANPNLKIRLCLTCAHKYCLFKQRNKEHSPLLKRGSS